MGTAGAGTVVDFDKLQYTATHTCNVTGIHRLNTYQRRVHLFVIFIIFLIKKLQYTATCTRSVVGIHRLNTY